MGGSRERGDRGSGPPAGKSLVAIGFLKTILARTPLEKQLAPLGPIASQERFVHPSEKYIDDLKNNNQDLPSGFLWIYPWILLGIFKASRQSRAITSHWYFADGSIITRFIILTGYWFALCNIS